jgi:pilus assembly protein Flp/PilA
VLAIQTKGRTLRSDKRGATAIEYGLIAALIAVAAMSGMKALGGGSNGMWGRLDNRVADTM